MSSSALKTLTSLNLETIHLAWKNPIQLFNSWYLDARKNPENLQPEQMTLTTIGLNGGPSARTVLMRGLDEGRIKMYWNKHSGKSQELARNNQASLVFVWSYKTTANVRGFRQVRIEGAINELPRPEVIEYFNSEPEIAKVRAVFQTQSRLITDHEREENLKKCQELLDQVQNNGLKIECPDSYVGFYLTPITMEFYQGLRDTLNDRIKFVKTSSMISGQSSDAFLNADEDWVYSRLEC